MCNGVVIVTQVVTTRTILGGKELTFSFMFVQYLTLSLIRPDTYYLWSK